jgi:hypothetical protein
VWHLLTTLPVATLKDAQEVIRFYRLRWRIEEVLRLMKKDGLDIEDSQVETTGRLFNLAALALAVAARTIQLVDARDGFERCRYGACRVDLLRRDHVRGRPRADADHPTPGVAPSDWGRSWEPA